MRYAICLLLYITSSCGHSPFRGNDILGADEFVMDSYKIREGKFAILELEGKHFEPLAQETLEEYTLNDTNRGKIELAGLVHISSLPVDGKLRLFEALSLAQVPAHANWFKSYLIRNKEILPIDFSKLVNEGDMSQNIVLRSGDKIYIAQPSASSIMVLGEVGNEGAFNLPNGYTHLKMALAEAGGISYFGDKAFIQVIRGNLLQPKLYTLHWNHIMRLPNESLLLIPGDIVYVASTPIAEWNRFITQLLPSLISVDLITKGGSNNGVLLP